MTSSIKQKEPEKIHGKPKKRSFATSKKVNVDFCLPKFSATKIATWKCHVDEYSTGRYAMILGIDLLTALGLDLKFKKKLSLAVKDHTKGVMYKWLT